MARVKTNFVQQYVEKMSRVGKQVRGHKVANTVNVNSQQGTSAPIQATAVVVAPVQTGAGVGQMPTADFRGGLGKLRRMVTFKQGKVGASSTTTVNNLEGNWNAPVLRGNPAYVAELEKYRRGSGAGGIRVGYDSGRGVNVIQCLDATGRLVKTLEVQASTGKWRWV